MLQLNSSNTLRQKKTSLMVTNSDVTDKPMKQDVTTVAEFTKFLSVCPDKGPKEQNELRKRKKRLYLGGAHNPRPGKTNRHADQKTQEEVRSPTA